MILSITCYCVLVHCSFLFVFTLIILNLKIYVTATFQNGDVIIPNNSTTHAWPIPCQMIMYVSSVDGWCLQIALM